MQTTPHENILIASALRMTAIDLRDRLPEQSAEMEALANRFTPAIVFTMTTFAQRLAKCLGISESQAGKLEGSLTLGEKSECGKAILANDSQTVERIVGMRAIG